MDCDTTGIEPDFALVKFKNSQRSIFKIINQSFQPSGSLGIPKANQNIIEYVQGTSRLEGPVDQPRDFDREKASLPRTGQIDSMLPSVFDLSFAFTK